MRSLLLLGYIALCFGLAFVAPAPTRAAEADSYWLCATTGNASNWCPSTATNPLPVAPSASANGGATYTHIAAGQANTVVKSGAGTLYAVVFNSQAAATNVTTLFDNTAASGTVIGIPNAVSIAIGQGLYFGPSGLAFTTGLTISTATANGGDMTVIWK